MVYANFIYIYINYYLIRKQIFFRKILPQNNNVPAKALSKSANDLNRKKLKVNSQITAMIAMLELSCNISYTIILTLISKKTTFSTLITVMSTYLVILPYSFLMNTSHNKNRIVDAGWKNILKNIFQYSQISF